MTSRLAIDREVCAGHGLCYGAEPDLVDSDDQGYPVLLRPQLADGELAAAERLVGLCPERALALQPAAVAERVS